ncbi:MgtC/SapB family protein [Haloparvum alkalitolerans]|uniref:MgtC/SapB family protein n=1 Tax=Haloparvum alkalitolerans TaxID=1042953 RepID=UPI003CE8405E
MIDAVATGAVSLLPAPAQTFFGVSFEEPVVRLALAAALGLFLGLEREWSDKDAGIRTFSLTSLLAAVFTTIALESSFGGLLVVVGAVAALTLGVLLSAEGLRQGGHSPLALTTTVSLLVTYGVGVLVAVGFVLEGVVVSVLSSTLLVLKRELHSFAGNLSRREIRSATEFAILAFVIYPLLPTGQVDVLGVPLEPRVAWLMVVTVAAIGMANYVLVRTYGGRGIAVTGFFGGLASSAAVVGAMLDHIKSHPESTNYGVAGVLLSNAAMALRNLAIAVAFTVTVGSAVLWETAVPLGAIIVASVVIAYLVAEWDAQIEMELENPFSMRNALAFGSVFLFILAGSSVAQSEFGAAGLFVSALVSGLVSSAGVATSAVLLYRSGTIGSQEAVIAILLATAASILVKVLLAAGAPRDFLRRVGVWSAVTLAVGFLATAAMVLL